jgi:CheY-like chemotaxis protein
MDERPFRVLVVDDDPDVLYLFGRLLGGPPKVDCATGARQAIERAQQSPLDLVFMDVGLLSADGMDTLLQLKELAPDAIVIMIGEQAAVEDVERGISLGAHGFLAKPFSDIGEIIAIERASRCCSGGEVALRHLAREEAVLAVLASLW